MLRVAGGESLSAPPPALYLQPAEETSTMPRKFSQAEYAVIREHNDAMIMAAQAGIDAIRLCKGWEYIPHQKQRMQYWLNVRAGLRWSASVAMQRTQGPINVNG